MNETERPYTAKALADRVGITSSYIQRLCRQGRLECVKFGGYWLIQPEEAERFIAAREARMDPEDQKDR